MENGHNKKTGAITGWIFSIVVILFLLFDAIGKVMKLEAVVKETTRLGYPEAAIIPIGMVLLICTLLYAIPATSFWGAVLLTGYLGGAVATHLRVGNPLFTHMLFPVYLAILLWAGLYLRSTLLRKLSTGKSN